VVGSAQRGQWRVGNGRSARSSISVDAGAPAGAAQTLGGWVLATWVGVAMVVLLPVVLLYVTPAPKSATWLLASLLQAMAFLSLVVVSAIFASRWERASS
jgi:hypothetical protein